MRESLAASSFNENGPEAVPPHPQLVPTEASTPTPALPESHLNQEWAARNAATDVSASIVQECQREHLQIEPADSTCAGAKMGLGDHSAAFNTGAGHCKCRGKGLRKCGSNLATTRAAGSRSRGPRLRPAMPAIEKRHLRACLTGNSDWGAGNQGAFWVSSRAD